MKLLSYDRAGAMRHGCLVDAGRVAEIGGGDLSVLLAQHPDLRGWRLPDGLTTFDLAGLSLLAPLPHPPKVLAVAANYADHIRESGGEPPDKSTMVPRLFLKPASAVAGPGAVIALPEVSTQVDWEAELVAVIGRGGRNLPVGTALDAVAGYAAGNDVSARSVDYGMEREPGAPGASATWFFDWLAGKWLDGFAPFGPFLVTADEVGDPQNLEVRLEVNGRIRQDGNTRDMIFTVAELISFASRLMTLQPGDVIFTGTPSGVGMTTGDFLARGDEMSVTVGCLGTLTNSVR